MCPHLFVSVLSHPSSDWTGLVYLSVIFAFLSDSATRNCAEAGESSAVRTACARPYSSQVNSRCLSASIETWA